MKCNRETELVCYYYDKCKLAYNCRNVPRGIRENLKKQEVAKRLKEQSQRRKRD